MNHYALRYSGLLTACVAFSLAASVSTTAAQPVAGDKDVRLSGGFFHAQGSESGTVTADVALGYHFSNPSWQAGLRQGASYAFVDNARDQWTLNTEPFVRYHFLNAFGNEKIVPYIGGFVGAIYNDIDATGTLGPDVGLKLFLTDQTYVGLNYRYQWFFDDLDFKELTDDAADGNHVGTFAIGFVWGGDGHRTTGSDTVSLSAAEAASRAERAADKTEAAALRLEKLADEAERGFGSRLQK